MRSASRATVNMAEVRCVFAYVALTSAGNSALRSPRSCSVIGLKGFAQ